jgi:pterin-4a-carbinolamine dehydratase
MDEKLNSLVGTNDMAKMSHTIQKMDGIREKVLADISRLDVRMAKKIDSIDKDRD